jgi:hypothetical protein
LTTPCSTPSVRRNTNLSEWLANAFGEVDLVFIQMRIIYLVGVFNHLEKNISQWEMGRIIPYIMGKNVPNHQPVICNGHDKI